MRGALPLLVALALGAATRTAGAGERTALSAVVTLPEARGRVAADGAPTLGVAGLGFNEETGYAGGVYLNLVADSRHGYCLVERDGPLRMWREMSAEVVRRELWRLVVTGDDQATQAAQATFERTRFEVDLTRRAMWVTSRSTVTLSRLATGPDGPVWGYRESTGNLVLLARGAGDGLEALPPSVENAGVVQETASDCTFGAVRIAPSLAASGAIAQLRGTRFVVEASVSKVSRDPEPLVSIRVRRRS